jgi:amino acid transporter
MDAGIRDDGRANDPEWLNPRAASSGMMPDLPERRSYRWKRRLLGPPLVSENLQGERLGKPVALAVLSSDVMSSSAYATESMLRILIPAAGIGAFALVTPITGLILVILAVICLLYRQVVKAYPVSGGSYVVSRENFGYSVAQIPGAALLCSYTLTVAVSIAAGVDAIISAFPALHYPVPMAVIFVVLLTYGNLRGIREAGRVFAVPTYWFVASMAVLLLAGLVRLALHGHLAHVVPRPGHLPVAGAGGGLLFGAGLFIVLRGFANGGSAMTGMEAISNAVTVFREPQVRNARTTLLLMAGILGTMFLGVSALAALTHAQVYGSGTPTVLSELGKQIFGRSGLGHLGYYSLQFSTALILILGANTSYNGFPLLVSFIAQDAFLPRPLTTRGHRLVFSNGIFVLSILSVALLVVSRARVANLIPLYACTVFTGFTMAGAGMVRYHMRHPDEPHRGRNLAIALMAFIASAVVTLIFVVTEFTRGAWLIVVVIPLLVATLAWTHRRYEAEKAVLAEDASSAASEAPVLPHHVVVVLVDRLDLATARGIQLARSLAAGGEVRAVHFILDAERAARMSKAWGRLGLDTVPLDLIQVPDRRLVRASAELAADLARDGRTEVLLVLPRRTYQGLVSRVLHDNTADRIVSAVSQIPNVSATVAPFDVSGLVRRRAQVLAHREERPRQPAVAVATPDGADGADRTAPDWGDPGPGPRSGNGSPGGLSRVRHRERVRVSGRVHSVRVQPWAGVPAFECTLVDAEGGAITAVFFGRRSVPGIEPGTELTIEGAVGSHHGRLAILNPIYEIHPPTQLEGAADAG